MKDNDFNDLLKSIDQARAIHRGELRAQRTYKFDPLVVKRIRPLIVARKPRP
jgi:hypothetical protein